MTFKVSFMNYCLRTLPLDGAQLVSLTFKLYFSVHVFLKFKQ